MVSAIPALLTSPGPADASPWRPEARGQGSPVEAILKGQPAGAQSRQRRRRAGTEGQTKYPAHSLYRPLVRRKLLNLGNLYSIPDVGLRYQQAFFSSEKRPTVCFSGHHHGNHSAMPSRPRSREWWKVTFSITCPFHSQFSFLPPQPQSDFPCCSHSQGLFLPEQWTVALGGGCRALGQEQTMLGREGMGRK